MPSAGYLRSTVAWYGGLGLLTGQVARNLALPPKYVRLVVQEIEVMGVRSAGVALVAALFTGMVLALQSGVNMARFGAETYVGPLVALSILRELGPVLTAILVGGKVASGITAELGSMLVTEQIDALRSLGVNYIKRLVVPRVLAALIVFPLLTILADGVGLMGGAVIAVFERARLPDRGDQERVFRRPRHRDRVLQRARVHRRHRGARARDDRDRRTGLDGRHRLRFRPDQAAADPVLVNG